MSKIDAVVLAGAPAGPEMDAESGMSRAMIKLGDKTMLQWVIDALKGAPSVGRVAVVGKVAGEGIDVTVEPGGDLMTNIKLGMEALGAHDRVLVVSSDIPLLTPEAIEDFLNRAAKLDVDLAYPVIPRMHCESKYPGMKRTYLKTADGVFTGGNLMLVRPEFVFNNWGAIAEAYGARKQVWKLARMIGIGVLARVILAQALPGVLKIAALEAAVSRMVRAKVSAIVSAYPEIGEDVDKPSDVEAVREILASRGGQ